VYLPRSPLFQVFRGRRRVFALDAYQFSRGECHWMGGNLSAAAFKQKPSDTRTLNRTEITQARRGSVSIEYRRSFESELPDNRGTALASHTGGSGWHSSCSKDLPEIRQGGSGGAKRELMRVARHHTFSLKKEQSKTI